MFALLAWSILGNLTITLAVVLGAGILLGLLTMMFSLAAWIISHWPVPNWRHIGSLLALIPALLLGLLLLRLSPGFGALLLVIVALGVLVALLPTPIRAEIQLSLRNIGRARVRSATTLVALFVGVFAVGLGLVLGQNLKDFLFTRSAQVNPDNAYILASSQDAPLVAARIAGLANVSHEQVSVAAPIRLVAINGQSIPAVAAQGETATLSGINGFDLAAGSLPLATLEQGAQDTRKGRLLSAADAGTANAVFPLSDSEAPARLKVGDDVLVSSLDGKATQTLHVVGFYTGLGTSAALSAILSDKGAATTLGEGSPYTIFALRLPASAQNADLQAIRQAVPGVITLGDAAAISQIESILDNIIQVVEAIASLAMFAGLVLIANTVALAMLERRRELGVLKAIGHTSGGVLSMVIVENGVLGIIGASSALILVSLGATLLARLTFDTATAPNTPIALILALAGATVALCMLVAGSVAWRSTHIRPLDVLRYE
jgi:predicted lysophospholipase L1 biosynthesis ABC-type transport system permease subunit